MCDTGILGVTIIAINNPPTKPMIKPVNILISSILFCKGKKNIWNVQIFWCKSYFIRLLIHKTAYPMPINTAHIVPPIISLP